MTAFQDLDPDRDVELFRRFYRDVLSVSFAAAELDDLAVMERRLRGAGDVQLLVSVALDGDGAPIGGVTGEVYAPEQVLLLSYLAVRPDLRGHGIGTALVERVGPRWYSLAGVRLAVAEVHDPRAFPDVEGEDASSRLRFYGRLGARVLGVPFVQPALDPGGARIPGFLLVALHVDSTLETRRGDASELRSDILGKFVRRYFEAAEGVRDPSDAQLDQLLDLIDDPPTIALLPIADYERVPLLP